MNERTPVGLLSKSESTSKDGDNKQQNFVLHAQFIMNMSSQLMAQCSAISERVAKMQHGTTT